MNGGTSGRVTTTVKYLSVRNAGLKVFYCTDIIETPKLLTQMAFSCWEKPTIKKKCTFCM